MRAVATAKCVSIKAYYLVFFEHALHVQAVKFSVRSHAPVPFMLCYCSICRKTGVLLCWV